MVNTISLSKNKFLLTQVQDHQYIIESHSDKIKIVGENEYSVSCIDIDNGPLIHLGKDFLGRGVVGSIELIDTNNSELFMVKVTLQ